MRKQSKGFKELLKQMDVDKKYPITEALELCKKLSNEKFDASVEVHVHTGVDPKKNEQQVRSSIVLPHGTGKTKRVAVFAEGDKANEAKEAGADLIGGMELITQIKQTGKADFDVAIATPDMMKNLASVAKVLGPRGLMPSPKNETVTTNVKNAVEQVKKGKVDFRSDDSGNMHQVIGKRSFTVEQLEQNYKTFMDALRKAKPSSAKGVFVQTVTIASTMGPAIKVVIE